MDKHAPIGIFDSGIGGLTVAKAIHHRLPNEQIIYFGDTAHLPYGDKSAAAIQAYSIKIADVLLSRGCKVIVIACNSASSAAYELMKEYVGSRAEIINVIDPMVDFVVNHYPGKQIGLIGTRQTISSNVYKDRIEEMNAEIVLASLATALLVPMIEEGFMKDQISHDVIETYLGDPSLEGIEALILGCTHYPLIKSEITNYYNHQVDALDSSEIVAESLAQHLKKHGLLNDTGGSDNTFYVSDFTDSFEQLTKRFFGEQIHLINHQLWE